MLQEEFFSDVTAALNDLALPYMITGSMASNFYGQPRLTHDIDFVLILPQPQAETLTSRFPGPRYYLSREAVADARARAGMFNIIDSQTGLKADCWILDQNDEYRMTAFQRRQKAELLGQPVFMATAEDVILSKLDWYRKCGESTQQFQDAKAVYIVQRENLDTEYLQRWARVLCIEDLLAKIVEQAK